MYLIKNEDQKLKTLKHIQEYELKLSRIRKDEGSKAAAVFAQVWDREVLEWREQIGQYEALKKHGLQRASFDDPVELGRYMVQARIAAGLTQAQLANKLGVSQPMVHKYELGEYAGAGLHLLSKVARILGVSIAVKAAFTGRGRVAANVSAHHP